MTRQFGCFLGLFSLCVTTAWGAERTRVAACPSPTIVVPHPLPTIPVSLPRPPLAEKDLSPIEHIRRAADHLEAGAVGPIAEQMCDQAEQLRKLADDLEKDAAARLAELRKQLSEIQAEISKLELLADPTEQPQAQLELEPPAPASPSSDATLTEPMQIQVDLEILEIDVTKAKKLGVEFEFLVENGCKTCRAAKKPSEQDGAIQLAYVQPLAGIEGSSMRWDLLPANTAASLMKALVEQGLAKVLAKPSLITTSGRPASIHSGGEFPVLTPQDAGTVSVEWHEFGVRVEVVPVVLDNGKLRLDVAPEVSERDFSNSVTVEGMVVPGITTRRVNTQVVMEFGQTLVIGGMTSTSAPPVQPLPIATNVPYVGRLLKWICRAPVLMSIQSSIEPREKRLVILATPTRVDAQKK